MDETGVEPMTFRLQGERATNYATRPVIKFELEFLASVPKKEVPVDRR